MPTRPIRHTVDGRTLAPPEPLELTLDALETLGTNEAMLLLLEREPFPLYRLLTSSGHAWQTERRADGVFEIRIWRTGS